MYIHIQLTPLEGGKRCQWLITSSTKAIYPYIKPQHGYGPVNNVELVSMNKVVLVSMNKVEQVSMNNVVLVSMNKVELVSMNNVVLVSIIKIKTSSK